MCKRAVGPLATTRFLRIPAGKCSVRKKEALHRVIAACWCCHRCLLSLRFLCSQLLLQLNDLVLQGADICWDVIRILCWGTLLASHG